MSNEMIFNTRFAAIAGCIGSLSGAETDARLIDFSIHTFRYSEASTPLGRYCRQMQSRRQGQAISWPYRISIMFIGVFEVNRLFQAKV